jgi:hypothetical protein
MTIALALEPIVYPLDFAQPPMLIAVSVRDPLILSNFIRL